MKRKICVFTGTRAEYGLLKPLMAAIGENKELSLSIIVSGTHLSKEFGSTYKEIEKDGLKIDRKIDIAVDDDSAKGVARSMGLAIEKLVKACGELCPDIIVILGDRYEAFAAAAAAMLSLIPVAHLHGGEATYGVMDEAIRHSITKMSHLHFTSTEDYRRRVIQLGESPGRVFNVGALGIDNIRALKALEKNELERSLGFRFGKKNVLVTYHPVTLEKGSENREFAALLSVLDTLSGINVVFTYANADMGGRGINRMIDAYTREHPERTVAVPSMGNARYLSAMKYVDAVVGNSSSGIIEAPSFGIGTINIGDRQKGRTRAKSVIDCRGNEKDIFNAFKKLYRPSFRAKLKNVKNPYGDGKTAARIVKEIKSYDLKDILKKSFYDLK